MNVNNTGATIKRHNGFTLIELMIVIVIMGLVYMLALQNLSQIETITQKKKITLDNLAQKLKEFPFEKFIRVVCYNDCTSCVVELDHNTTQPIDFLVDAPVEMFRYDERQGLLSMSYPPFFDQNNIEKNVCFSYSLGKTSSPQGIVFITKKNVYDMSNPYDVTVYKTQEELIDAKRALLQKVLE